MSSTNIDFNDKQVKQLFQPYLPSPDNLKSNADNAKKWLNILNSISIDRPSLKPREERMISQFRYFLESNFDNIYQNYYDGVWMLGPDYFCEQAICFTKSYLMAALRRITVKTLKDLELIIFWVKEHRRTFKQYLTNVKEGIKRGMVQPYEVCRSSAKTFSTVYSKVHYGGPSGALTMAFARLLNSTEYYRTVTDKTFADYHRKHGESYRTAVDNAIVDDFGKPLKELIIYLKQEHWRYCPPSNLSSGLGGLPLKYQYLDGERRLE